MAETKFLELIEQLEAEIAAAGDDSRHEMQAELHKVVEQMQAQGLRVPQRLVDLDHQLTDEAVEDMFDNMPV